MTPAEISKLARDAATASFDVLVDALDTNIADNITNDIETTLYELIKNATSAESTEA